MRSPPPIPLAAGRQSACAWKWTKNGSASPTGWTAGTGSACRRSFDASILSDEAQTPGTPNFTGAFVGMACQDMAGTGRARRFRLVLLSRARFPDRSFPRPRHGLLTNQAPIIRIDSVTKYRPGTDPADGGSG